MNAVGIAVLAVTALLLPCGGRPAGASELLEQLKGNTRFTAEAFGSYYFEEAEAAADSRPIDNKDGQLWSRLTVESRAFFGETMSLEFEGYLAWTTHSGEYNSFWHHPDYNALDRPGEGDITLLNVTHQSDGYALTVGKAMLDIGLAEIFSPTDRFNPVNAAYPQQPRADGFWQARLDWYLEQDMLAFIYTPYEEHGWMPHPGSRWYGGGDPDFFKLPIPAGFSVTDAGGVHNPGYMVLYEGVRSGGDFFLFAHHGPSVYPVLRSPSGLALTYGKEYPVALSTGGGVSRVSGAWKYYGEVIHQRTRGGADQDFFKYVAGFSYRETRLANKLGLDEIQPIVEYAGEWVTSSQKDGYLVDSSEARPGRNTLIFSLHLLHNEKWSYSLHGTRNLTKDDYALGAGAEYKHNDNLSFTMTVRSYSGKEDTQFGRWRRNDNLALGIRYVFGL